ncbi:MAG TPA: 2-dehydropantoate 2-reductase N-terminal domain-containing protein [Mycobacteriales bacterium]|nr:2-dehydropantoate 2-reductase N-terminal domain-containing protein [Mycobacteriales bacterium]
MRYVIVGAGAVGGTIGGRLAQHGREVLLVARGAHAAAMRERGLRLATPDGVYELPIPVADDVARLQLRSDDVLVLAVKTQDTIGVLDALAGSDVVGGTAGSALPIVCAQNAVENERMAARRFRRVYAMCVMLPATHLTPGTVAAEGTPLSGMLDLGRYPGGIDATAEQICADLAASRFRAEPRADIMRWKYTKLLRNLGNALDATVGDAAGDITDQVRAEGRAVLDAAGIDYASFAEDDARRGSDVQVRPVEGRSRQGGSSWQSLARGAGSIEADYLNGEIVLLGRLHGVATPANEALAQWANRMVSERRQPGTVSADEIRATIKQLSLSAPSVT